MEHMIDNKQTISLDISSDVNNFTQPPRLAHLSEPSKEL